MKIMPNGMKLYESSEIGEGDIIYIHELTCKPIHNRLTGKAVENVFATKSHRLVYIGKGKAKDVKTNKLWDINGMEFRRCVCGGLTWQTDWKRK